MPKDTFFRLPDDKRNRILKGAKKEFYNCTFSEASINRIIKDAEIPRGSFYQYFEDKKDLYLYVIEENYGFIPVLAIITADNAITAVI